MSDDFKRDRILAPESETSTALPPALGVMVVGGVAGISCLLATPAPTDTPVPLRA